MQRHATSETRESMWRHATGETTANLPRDPPLHPLSQTPHEQHLEEEEGGATQVGEKGGCERKRGPPLDNRDGPGASPTKPC